MLKEGVEYKIKITFKVRDNSFIRVSHAVVGTEMLFQLLQSVCVVGKPFSTGCDVLSFPGQQGDRFGPEVHPANIQERSEE